MTVRPPGLVDVLDRILDKGLVIAGDVKISLANVELLTLQIRLLICSIDKAEQIGLNWWRYDPHLSSRGPQLELEGEQLRARLAELERQVQRLSSAGDGRAAAKSAGRSRQAGRRTGRG